MASTGAKSVKQVVNKDEYFQWITEQMLHEHEASAGFHPNSTSPVFSIFDLRSQYRTARIQYDREKDNILQTTRINVNSDEAQEFRTEVEAYITELHAGEARTLLNTLKEEKGNVGHTILKLKARLAILNNDHGLLAPESSNKSADMMETELNQVIGRAYLGHAQSLFNELSDEDALYCENKISDIEASLKKAGVDLSHLDPDREKTALEMQKILDDKISVICTREAQKIYTNLETAPPNNIVKIRELLKVAGKNLDVLDDQKTVGDINGELLDASRKVLVKELRKNFEEFQGEPSDFNLDRVKKSLRGMGRGLGFLDPDGEKSDLDMQAEIAQIQRNYALVKAQRIYTALVKSNKNAAYHFENWDNHELYEQAMRSGKMNDKIGSQFEPTTHTGADIRNYLKIANADFSALDPDGEKSASEMEEDLISAEKEGYTWQARFSYRKNMHPSCVVDPLSKGNLDVSSVLNLKNDQTVKEATISLMQEFAGFSYPTNWTKLPGTDPESLQLAKEFYEEARLQAARELFTSSSTHTTRSYAFEGNQGQLTSIYYELQLAGADISALDPDGETTSEDMEQKLQERYGLDYYSSQNSRQIKESPYWRDHYPH